MTDEQKTPAQIMAEAFIERAGGHFREDVIDAARLLIAYAETHHDCHDEVAWNKRQVEGEEAKPVAWRARKPANDDGALWAIIYDDEGANYLNQKGWEVQPLYTRVLLSSDTGGEAKPVGSDIQWTPELEAARIKLCEFWIKIADDPSEGGARYPELGKNALETEAALTILGDIVAQIQEARALGWKDAVEAAAKVCDHYIAEPANVSVERTAKAIQYAIRALSPHPSRSGK